MGEVGRNEPCYCGSGKKYKKCCFNRDNLTDKEKLYIWKVNAQEILEDESKSREIINTLFAILKTIISDDMYSGFCYASVAIAYILLKEQGINAVPCIGDIRHQERFMNHSWLEINNEVYDVAIYKTLINTISEPPTIKGFNVHKKTPAEIEYRVVSGLPDSDEEKMVKGMSFKNYMDGLPVFPRGLWSLVEIIGKEIGLTIDIEEIINKYSDTKWLVLN